MKILVKTVDSELWTNRLSTKILHNGRKRSLGYMRLSEGTNTEVTEQILNKLKIMNIADLEASLKRNNCVIQCNGLNFKMEE